MATGDRPDREAQPERRIHQACGEPMIPMRFDHHNPVHEWRSQPIWTCVHCQTWEKREGWQE